MDLSPFPLPISVPLPFLAVEMIAESRRVGLDAFLTCTMHVRDVGRTENANAHVRTLSNMWSRCELAESRPLPLPPASRSRAPSPPPAPLSPAPAPAPPSTRPRLSQSRPTHKFAQRTRAAKELARRPARPARPATDPTGTGGITPPPIPKGIRPEKKQVVIGDGDDISILIRGRRRDV